MKPFAVIYSTFLQRAFDPIVHDVCLQNLPVVFPMDRAGLSGDDGPTHHGLFDIAYLRGIPNIIHMAPKNEDEFVDMLYTCLKHEGPSAIRYPRGTGPGAKIKDEPALLEIGKGEITRPGSRVSLWGLGTLHPMAEETADLLHLHHQIHAEVINPRFIKPLDRDLLRASASRCDVICTFEDHVLNNGFGAAVITELADMNIDIPVVRIGWPDQFIDHGKVDALREKHGLTAHNAVKKILEKLDALTINTPEKPRGHPSQNARFPASV
jgi:1-deoxy-D-xylulose-5-phosphate synthase